MICMEVSKKIKSAIWGLSMSNSAGFVRGLAKG
jgi:hypothetical protein